MAVLTSVFISGMMVLIGRNILSLFVSGEPEQIRQVLDIAYKYLFIMAVFLWILYLLHVYRSAIQGLGNTLIPLASGIAEFVMRVSVALLLPKWIGEEGIYYAEICAWSRAAVLLIIVAVKHWMKGMASASSILIGIVAGYIIAAIMGLVLPTTAVNADGEEYTKAWV